MTIIFYLILISILLWLVLIRPYNDRRNRMAELIPFRFAHRGLYDNDSDAPENSLEAFRLACEKGYGIELDIRETSDGQIVVCHDNHLKRVAGLDQKISEMTSSQIRQVSLFHSKASIPSFQEVLELVDGRVPLIVELKTEDRKRIDGFCENCAFFLDSYQGKAVIESFDPRVLYWFRRHHGLTLRGQLSDRFSIRKWSHNIGGFFLSCCVLNRFTKPDFVAYNEQHATRLRYQILRHMGVFGVAWTVKSREDLERADQYFDAVIFEGFLPENKTPVTVQTGGRDMSQIIRKNMLISGTVQAVGFRYRATYIAQDLGISGWVKNLYDGRVQLQAQGTKEQIEEMLHRLGKERFIKITAVEEMEIPPETEEYEFKVRY